MRLPGKMTTTPTPTQEAPMGILTRTIDYLARVMDSTDDRKHRYEPGLRTYANQWQENRAIAEMEPVDPETIVRAWDRMSETRRRVWAQRERETRP